MTAFGNVFGGILGGLAGGTAATTAQTNYVQIGGMSATTGPVYYGYQPAQNAQWQTNAWQSGWQTNQFQFTNTPAVTAQGLWGTGQITGAQLGGFGVTFTQAFFDIPLQAPNVWVHSFTPEQLKEMELAEEKRRIERAAAKVAATELLRSQLNPDQLEQFEQTGHFDVRIKDRIYQITPGRKVHALHEKEKPFLCIAPYGHELPNEDVALAQKLLLEANEKEFLKTAIRWAA